MSVLSQPHFHNEAAAIARDGVLLDSRGKAAYVGAPQEPGKPATGHIPGAFSAPSVDALNGDGCFKSSDELRADFAALGASGAVGPVEPMSDHKADALL